MRSFPVTWDDRSPEQWLEESDRFEKMADRLKHRPGLSASFRHLARNALMRAENQAAAQDTHRSEPLAAHGRAVAPDRSYLRLRTIQEKQAAMKATDDRVRAVHLELAERYSERLNVAESTSAPVGFGEGVAALA